MSASHLVVVPSAAGPQTAAEKIKHLQAEARDLARKQVEALGGALLDVSRLATEIAEGGDLYPVGAREVARRVADEAAKQSLTLTVIVERI